MTSLRGSSRLGVHGAGYFLGVFSDALFPSVSIGGWGSRTFMYAVQGTEEMRGEGIRGGNGEGRGKQGSGDTGGKAGWGKGRFLI